MIALVCSPAFAAGQSVTHSSADFSSQEAAVSPLAVGSDLAFDSPDQDNGIAGSEMAVGNQTLRIAHVSESQRQSALSRNEAAGAGTAGYSSTQGTGSFIQQLGAENAAVSSTQGSVGSTTATLQLGQANRAAAVVEDSPGSAILLAQLGVQNTAVAQIRGGEDNGIAIAQIGSGHVAGVSLVDSVGTTVLYGQVGINLTDGSQNLASSPNGQTGAYIIRNAPPGTVVRVGSFEESTQ